MDRKSETLKTENLKKVTFDKPHTRILRAENIRPAARADLLGARNLFRFNACSSRGAPAKIGIYS